MLRYNWNSIHSKISLYLTAVTSSHFKGFDFKFAKTSSTLQKDEYFGTEELQSLFIFFNMGKI